MGPVSTRRFFKCPRKNSTLNNHQNSPCTPFPQLRGVRSSNGTGIRVAQLLTRGLCWRGLALSDSSWSQLVRTHRAPQVSLPASARTRQRCVLVYLRVRPCLQQLSEIIRLYHVMPHVGIFPAVPERLFCFLRLASARRNAAY